MSDKGLIQLQGSILFCIYRGDELDGPDPGVEWRWAAHDFRWFNGCAFGCLARQLFTGEKVTPFGSIDAGVIRHLTIKQIRVAARFLVDVLYYFIRLSLFFF